MPARRRAVVLGEARGRAAVEYVARELDTAVRNLGLTYAGVASDVGLSPSQVSRIARGKSPDLSIAQAATLLASVGLDLAVRTYPTGRPLRDQSHLDLLERLRLRLHRSLGWRTEVPVAGGADLRAWDAVVRGDPAVHPVQCVNQGADRSGGRRPEPSTACTFQASAPRVLPLIEHWTHVGRSRKPSVVTALHLMHGIA
jgi:transcriptional regulator with XRE-family HTH domain